MVVIERSLEETQTRLKEEQSSKENLYIRINDLEGEIDTRDNALREAQDENRALRESNTNLQESILKTEGYYNQKLESLKIEHDSSAAELQATIEDVEAKLGRAIESL